MSFFFSKPASRAVDAIVWVWRGGFSHAGFNGSSTSTAALDKEGAPEMERPFLSRVMGTLLSRLALRPTAVDQIVEEVAS